MNLIRKTLYMFTIIVGMINIAAGFAITTEAIPNPSTNQWFDCMLVIIGVTISITGLRHIKEK